MEESNKYIKDKLKTLWYVYPRSDDNEELFKRYLQLPTDNTNIIRDSSGREVLHLVDSPKDDKSGDLQRKKLKIIVDAVNSQLLYEYDLNRFREKVIGEVHPFDDSDNFYDMINFYYREHHIGEYKLDNLDDLIKFKSDLEMFKNSINKCIRALEIKHFGKYNSI